MVSQANKHQIKLRFLAVGIWNTIFGYLAFFFLESVFSHFAGTGAHTYMLAIVLSNVVAMLMAYSLHRIVTFRSTTSGKKMLVEFGRFTLSNLTIMALSIGLLPVFVEMFGFSPKVAAAIIAVLCAVMNYLAHSRITFNRLMIPGNSKTGPL